MDNSFEKRKIPAGDSGSKQEARDSEDFKPIGGLYDDPREHGSAGTQHADEGTKERDDAGNKRRDPNYDNAAGSSTRGGSSIRYPADGHGNG